MRNRRRDSRSAVVKSKKVDPLRSRQPAEAGGDRSALRRYAAGAASVLILFAILLGIFVRCYAPGAPSPAWDYIYNTDEGHYSYCAHNMVNHGKFFMNDAKYALANPLFSFVQYLFAAPWGDESGIARYRAVSIVAGIAMSLLIGLFFPKGYLRRGAVALAMLSFMGVVQSRYGIPDTLLAATMTGCILLAARGGTGGSRAYLFFAGIAAVACAAVKFTGIVMIPVLLILPIACRTLPIPRLLYYRWIALGIATAGLILAIAVIYPDPAGWLHFHNESLRFARENANSNPLDFARGIKSMMLSPALHTLPILSVAALAWLIVIFIPKCTRGQADVDETLLALWLAASVCALASSRYQPSRWQIILLMPTLIAGLKYFLDEKRRLGAMGVPVLALLALPLYHSLYPDSGLNFTPALLLIVIVAPVIGVLCTARLKAQWRPAVISILIAFELIWQIHLLAAHVLPTYRMADPWRDAAEVVRSLKADSEFCLTGNMVQDLSLRAPINVIPTYYALDDKNMTDESLRSFYRRQSPPPTHVLFFRGDYNQWSGLAPGFIANLEPVGKVELNVGEIGWSTLVLFKIKDPGWLRKN